MGSAPRAGVRGVDADLDLVPEDAAEERRNWKHPGRAAEGAVSPELMSESGLRRRAEPDAFLAGLGAVAGDGDWDRDGSFRCLYAEDVGLDEGLDMAVVEDGMAAVRWGREEEGSGNWGWRRRHRGWGEEIAVGEEGWFDVSRSAWRRQLRDRQGAFKGRPSVTVIAPETNPEK